MLVYTIKVCLSIQLKWYFCTKEKSLRIQLQIRILCCHTDLMCYMKCPPIYSKYQPLEARTVCGKKKAENCILKPILACNKI